MINFSDINSLYVSPVVLQSDPPQYNAKVILNDGREALIRKGNQIALIAFRIPLEKINPGHGGRESEVSSDNSVSDELRAEGVDLTHVSIITPPQGFDVRSSFSEYAASSTLKLVLQCTTPYFELNKINFQYPYGYLK